MRALMNRRFASVLIAALLGSGCGGPPPKSPLSYTEDARRAYETAMVEYKDHNWLDAQLLMREVRRKYGYSKYARLAELRLADIDFEQDKFSEASREYKQFIHDHRGEKEEAAYASARIAECEYREINDTLLLPAPEERDQGSVLDAYRELKTFLKDHPDSKDAPRLCGMLEEVTGRLIGHELRVARFYLNRNNYEGTVGRVQYALRNYSTPLHCAASQESASAFGGIPEALLLLGETYLKMARREDARDAFEAVLRGFPSTGYAVEAQRYLKTA